MRKKLHRINSNILPTWHPSKWSWWGCWMGSWYCGTTERLAQPLSNKRVKRSYEATSSNENAWRVESEDPTLRAAEAHIQQANWIVFNWGLESPQNPAKTNCRSQQHSLLSQQWQDASFAFMANQPWDVVERLHPEKWKQTGPAAVGFQSKWSTFHFSLLSAAHL